MSLFNFVLQLNNRYTENIFTVHHIFNFSVIQDVLVPFLIGVGSNSIADPLACKWKKCELSWKEIMFIQLLYIFFELKVGSYNVQTLIFFKYLFFRYSVCFYVKLFFFLLLKIQPLTKIILYQEIEYTGFAHCVMRLFAARRSSRYQLWGFAGFVMRDLS